MENSNKTLKIIIAVLVILLIGAAFYIGMTVGKNNSKVTSSTSESSTSESTSEEVGQNLDINGTQVTNLMKNSALVLNITSLNNDEFFGRLYKSKGINANDLDDRYKVLAGTEALNEDSSKENVTVSIEDFKNYMVKVFGSSITYNNVEVKDSCYNHIYDSSQKAYVPQSTGCGTGAPLPHYYLKLVDAKEYSNKIEITEQVLLLTPTHYNLGVDPDVTYTISTPYDGTTLATIKGSTSDQINSQADGYLDKSNTYVYTFQKDTDGNYYFASIKLK